jgi:hypothetical protein
MPVSTEMLVADQCWVALALLHREHPERSGFSAREIQDRVACEAPGPVRPGIQPHIYLHNVANLAPNSARYRMFYRLQDGTYRLFRPGDNFHPSRKGKTKPKAPDLPLEYQSLLSWYEGEYCQRNGSVEAREDPVLQMLGLGQELWREGADAFVQRERSNWEIEGTGPPSDLTLAEKVWQRLAAHQGEDFQTARGLPFRYRLDGNGLWFFRDGRRINQRLSRGDVEKAVRRCPLDKVTDISDCRDSSYLFGVLTDRRIRGSAG